MRPGHNYSSGSEESLEPAVSFRIPSVAGKQRQLVDEHRPQREARGVAQAFGGYRSVTVEDSLEVLVEVLDGVVTQPVEDAPYLHSRICVRIRSSSARHQELPAPQASGARLLGQLLHEREGHPVV